MRGVPAHWGSCIFTALCSTPPRMALSVSAHISGRSVGLQQALGSVSCGAAREWRNWIGGGEEQDTSPEIPTPLGGASLTQRQNKDFTLALIVSFQLSPSTQLWVI